MRSHFLIRFFFTEVFFFLKKRSTGKLGVDQMHECTKKFVKDLVRIWLYETQI